MSETRAPREPTRQQTWRRPPNQNLIRRKAHWPVVGETEAAPRADPWEVAITGAVEDPRVWSLSALRALPQTKRVVDLHCVTRWSKLSCQFTGVRLMDLIDDAGPLEAAVSARFVAHTERAHDTSLSLADIQRCDPLVALEYEGAPLPAAHGGPVRIVTPGKYFYKSCKWLATIELMAEHRLGYWESGPGYHDGADPWREQRYITGSIPPDLRARMIAQRRFGGRDLLSCVFDGEDLAGLDATGATLRNTSFAKANLRGADFSRAYLVNARLEGANLAKARFIGTDVMGADFSGADLRGADFTEAELFGASFCAPKDQEGIGAEKVGRDGAIFDAETIIPEAQIETLTEDQAAYTRAALRAARSSQ